MFSMLGRFLKSRPLRLLHISLAAIALRLFLIAVAAIQDRLLHVRYTDVDYQVYTDAAESLLLGESPYAGRTELLQHPDTAYRYPPLIAILALPNVVFFPEWGKLLFSVCDVAAGCVIWRLLERLRSDGEARASVSLLLFNPFVFTLSTRGSCDSLVTLLLALFFDRLERQRITEAAVLYGMLVHVRLYPIIYTIPLCVYFVCGRGSGGAWRYSVASIVDFLRFGALSGCVFAILGLVSYVAYGEDFVEQVFVYHVRERIDSKHNFSVWFYPFWLYKDEPGVLHKLRMCSTILQLIPTIIFGLCPSNDIIALARVFTLQTLSFVAFNKVITAQYFLWFLQLLPLWVIPAAKSHCATKRMMVNGALWVGAEIHWLFWAYWLEFGQLAWTRPIVWAASLVFFAANINLLWACWTLDGFATKQE